MTHCVAHLKFDIRVSLLTLICCYLNGVSNAWMNYAALPGECSALSCENDGQCEEVIKYVHKCLCPRNFTGNRCEMKCECLNGGICLLHKTKCLCPVGFHGEKCEEEEASICDRKPCGKNSECILAGSLERYECKCAKGFLGPNCDVADHCVDDPCNGNQCISLMNGFHCRCGEGMTGERCEVDVNECVFNNPCNYGKCVNEFGGYRCECDDGFRGTHCELPLNPCKFSPCKNGLCHLSDDETGYICECSLGYAGADCSIKINNCAANSCLHGSTCIDSEDGYSCHCHKGFTGIFCEDDIDECATGGAFCLNGGTCVNKVGGHECLCVNGWEGENCSYNRDDCIGNYCEAGSICVDHVAKYTCECPPGRTGMYCQYDNPCASKPCQHDSECVVDTASGNYDCVCKKGYTGKDCSIDVDECEDDAVHCFNGGTCVNTLGSWHCLCRPGFIDPYCMNHIDRCSPNPCQNQGTCLDFGTRFECICMLGYTGRYCEKMCPKGYGGKNCTQVQSKSCESKKCFNGGVCSKGSCRCPNGYSGSFCEQKSDPCQHSSCLGNSICVQSSNGLAYECVCKHGFAGKNCQVQMLEECSRKDFPCFNGGTCVIESGVHRCRCAKGFVGESCQITSGDCDTNPCKNNGRCTTSPGGYKCECPKEFTGHHCEAISSRCGPSTCKNGAICTELIDGVECVCAEGYSGKLCEFKNNDCHNKSCSNDCAHRVDGKNCKEIIDEKEFEKSDIIDKGICVANNCSILANNNLCDQSCNLFACDFDGGDCSAKVDHPFGRCAIPSYCAHVYNDLKCDHICNSEECLFDGSDCDGSAKQCGLRDFCIKRYNDGHCDRECDNVECGWDGKDCEYERAMNFTVVGRAIIIVLVKPEQFLLKVQQFLFTLGQKLRASVSISLIDGKPMIYSWDYENGIGTRFDVPEPLIPTMSFTYNIRKRRDSYGNLLSGTMVALSFDVSRCIIERREDCFSDIYNIVNYFGAAKSKNKLDDLGLPLYSARAEIDENHSKVGNEWIVTICSVGFLVVSFTFACLLMLQGRKRKSIKASIWYPPRLDSGKSLTANFDSFDFNGGLLYDSSSPSKYSQFGPTSMNVVHINSDVLDQHSPTFHCAESRSDFLYQISLNHRLIDEANGIQPISTPIDRELVNIRGKSRRTPLMVTVANQLKSESSTIEDIKNLLSAGADINAHDCDENTALMLAVKSGRPWVAEYLLNAGANPNIVDDRDRTILHHAVAVQSLEIVQLLLSANMLDVDAADDENRTPLIVCAMFDMMGPEIAELLINAGASLDLAGNKSSLNCVGKTALHFAAQHCNIDIIKILVQSGATKDVRDHFDQTPLFMAASEGHIEAVELLIQLGADIDITDQKDRSPYDIASEKMYFDVANYLLSVKTRRSQPGNILAISNVSHQQQPKRPGLKRNIFGSLRNGKPSSKPASLNPLTPPPSDGSNYSTTPSPSTLNNPQRYTASLQQEAVPLKSPSVVMSPFSDHVISNGQSPPHLVGGIGMMWHHIETIPLNLEESSYKNCGNLSYSHRIRQIQAYSNQYVGGKCSRPTPYQNF